MLGLVSYPQAVLSALYTGIKTHRRCRTSPPIPTIAAPGGGFLIVPALTLFLGLSMSQAVGTSLVIIAINSAAGFSAHATGFTMDWAPTLAFTIPAIAGSLAASRLSHKLNGKHIRTAFATLVFAVAAIVAVATIAPLAGS
ncbi:MAG TPA: sulfite exporter TauE/SafE family protein [Arthrobacter sp.]|nr:sulfite exporter TauE/SafE family protein [Arthrobacter sp.]